MSEQLQANVDCMLSMANGQGTDYLIVTSSTPPQASFWQERLDQTIEQLTGSATKVVSIEEDWPGGADNGLGTLYAIKKARSFILEHFQVDLPEELDRGATVVLYHTAGKGTRLAPLPLAEYNNKSGVKMPGLIQVGDDQVPITILEAVIRQTSCYSLSRKGRVSVFWGDQIFIPSEPMTYKPSFHVDILSKHLPYPTEDEWEEKGLSHYGVVVIDDDGSTQQVEKLPFVEFSRLISQGRLKAQGGFGISLGAFSLSKEMTAALLEEFKPELQAREGQLNSDLHFWMPLTLDRSTYTAVAQQKGITVGDAGEHHHRMQTMKEKVLATSSHKGILGTVDIGQDALWWDYGQVSSFLRNNLKLLEEGLEGQLMRRFFGIDERHFDPHTHTVVMQSSFLQGKIQRSVLVDVHAREVEAEDSVLIDCTAPSIITEKALLYDILDSVAVEAGEGEVRADVFRPGAHDAWRLKTEVQRNGKEDWTVIVEENPKTYAQVYEDNLGQDLTVAVAEKRKRKAQLKEKI